MLYRYHFSVHRSAKPFISHDVQTNLKFDFCSGQNASSDAEVVVSALNSLETLALRLGMSNLGILFV
jgi:hypothetical protein